MNEINSEEPKYRLSQRLKLLLVFGLLPAVTISVTCLVAVIANLFWVSSNIQDHNQLLTWTWLLSGIFAWITWAALWMPTYKQEVDSFYQKALQAFARSRGLNYLRSLDPTYLKEQSHTSFSELPDILQNPLGALFPGGKFFEGYYPKHVITGLISSYNFSAYIYRSGTRRKLEAYKFNEEPERDYLIVTVELPRMFPQIFLNRLGRKAKSVPEHYKRNQKLILEGDFNKYFDSYIAAGSQVEALQLLSPDNMQSLMEEAVTCDIEFVKDRCILYWSFNNAFEQYASALQITQALLNELQRELAEIPAHKAYIAVQPNVKRLKRRRRRLSFPAWPVLVAWWASWLILSPSIFSNILFGLTSLLLLIWGVFFVNSSIRNRLSVSGDNFHDPARRR